MDAIVENAETTATALNLTNTTPNGNARQIALQAAQDISFDSTSLVSYQSAGRLIIIGTLAQALSLAEQLSQHLTCLLVLPTSEMPPEPKPIAFKWCYGDVEKIDGFLGQFTVIAENSGHGFNVASLFESASEYADLVLDLTTPAHMRHEIPPPGYYAPQDEASLQAALETLPDMQGEFDKPKFFNYQSDICAHGSSGQQGCRRCIEACPTLAITSLGDNIHVNPNLCQGGGSCATACPSGAITYAYPKISDTLKQLRILLAQYTQAGGRQAHVVFYGSDLLDSVQQASNGWAENILPYAIEEIGAVGLDCWLACLAYGARQISLLHTPDTAPSIVRELHNQLGFAEAILTGMGYPKTAIQLLSVNPTAVNGLDDSTTMPDTPTATFAGLNVKRQTIDLALAHLYQHAPTPTAQVALPEHAPFGEVQVDKEACTLCMSCVTVCPMNALLDGQDKPQLRFNESLCVQCGICESACPEDAISLSPRLIYEKTQRQQVRLLHEEQPFHCITCGKAFATETMINKMTEKLKDHWMFQGEALKRLQMCEDCRVVAMMEEQDK